MRLQPCSARPARARASRTDRCCHDRRQRGIVLFIALIAMVALAVASIALARVIATTAAISGNLATRQAAILATSGPIEQAVAAVFETGATFDTEADDLARGYRAARQPGDDARGVPRVLQHIEDYPPGAPVIDAGGAITARHLIERLCLGPGPATAATCTLSPPSVEAALGETPQGEPPRAPYYRVTVRADAPGGATTFVQAMLGSAANRPRLSWRVLDE